MENKITLKKELVAALRKLKLGGLLDDVEYYVDDWPHARTDEYKVEIPMVRRVYGGYVFEMYLYSIGGAEPWTRRYIFIPRDKIASKIDINENNLEYEDANKRIVDALKATHYLRSWWISPGEGEDNSMMSKKYFVDFADFVCKEITYLFLDNSSHTLVGNYDEDIYRDICCLFWKKDKMYAYCYYTEGAIELMPLEEVHYYR